MIINEAPEKIYVPMSRYWYGIDSLFYPVRQHKNDTEYIRTDAFIEKAAEFLYNYNQKQVLKHGARATLCCGEYTINVDKFKNYMKGE